MAPRVLVLGTGFAGFHCLRTLERELPPDAAELVAVNPADYMLYIPLLPEVSGGVLDPRRVAVPLRNLLKRTKLVLGAATAVSLAERQVRVTDVEGRERTFEFDRLLMASGSVTRLLSIPGVAEHAKGFRTVAEAIHLRDHVLRQLELADQSDDLEEKRARCTFVVVGAGYTGTEVVAQTQLMTKDAWRHLPGLKDVRPRWILVDIAPRVLPGLDPRLSAPTHKVLTRRGAEIRLKTSVSSMTGTCVRLSDGSEIPTRTVVWCVGVRPDPLVGTMNVSETKGRIDTDTQLRVCEDVWAAGDVAAVPDLTMPGEITAMTAQHAERQGRVAGLNIAASLGFGKAREYKHHDLGFVVDLGGWQAVANPLHVPLRGLVAKLVARGYHLMDLPFGRIRTAANWVTELGAGRQITHFGVVPDRGLSLAQADLPPHAAGSG
ncbi:NADH dehydrogenase [Lentzea guizhouensis]|uniref:NADH dehydrogenase n=1 Tax=Lentzea guizhouensis TaxID=1586287 RepID=A0A1B2HD54_9PSEU|nr:FAD-dependent oxidoreductase [Lentzea guizhouensis]ANZ35653.1 NADH dehydrogenase [Lentzea guizhouensis]